jgi:hypothetical protein
VALTSAAPTPEPSAITLLGICLSCLAACTWRKCNGAWHTWHQDDPIHRWLRP